jgi:hypothetical protein
MKKIACFSTAFIAAATCSLFAAPQKGNGQNGGIPLGQMQEQQGQTDQNQMMMGQPDCTKLSADEQNFAYQIMDMNNKSMFCTQFTSQQRQQAMQMMGQTDASGNMMTADMAVKKVMKNNGMAPMPQQQGRSTGGCPVK